MGDQDPGSDEGTDFLTGEEAAANGGHPAWQEILNAIPEDYRDAVMPTLEKWDKGVQNRFQSLHSKYEPLKAYEGQDPETIQMGLNLIARIEEDPRAVYELMAQTYGFAAEQGASEIEGDMTEQYGNPEGTTTDPAILSQLQELQAQQAQFLQAQQDQENAEQLDAYMTYLHDTHGEFDDDYVVTLLANGVDGEDAVKRYNAIVENAGTTQRPSAPKVMPSGGGVPSRTIDPVALSTSEAKDLVTQMLLQAQQGE